jgi:acetyl esterase/lipase
MSTYSRRDMAKLGGAAALWPILGTIAPAQGAAGEAPGFDIERYVDPELRAAVRQMRDFTATPPTLAGLPNYRKAAVAREPQPAESPPWSERRISGRAGEPDVTVYVINARPGAGRPAILHVHGGGYISGTARGNIRRLQKLALALDCVIVTVDFRLAPETHWSGILEDGYAGLKWLHDHATELGVDPARIAVYGWSSGGGFAALLAIAARNRGEVPLVFQALAYPMLDDRTGSTRQKPPFMGGAGWTPAHNRFAWQAFLGVPPGSARVPSAAAPARVENFRGLPPAFIGVGSIDLFVDEDIAYAQRLIASGVATQLEVVPGAFHAFDTVPGTRIGARFELTVLNAFRKAFDLPVV